MIYIYNDVNSITNYYSIKKYSDDYYKLTLMNKYQREKSDILSSLKVDDKLDNNYSDKIVGEYLRFGESLSRAKNKVFEYAFCNKFEYFVTLTLDPERYNAYDLDTYIKDLGQFLRNYRSYYKTNVQYVLIPEQHKSGAWHLHGLVNGIVSAHLEINDNGYLQWKQYSKRFGYMSLSRVRDSVSVAKYITKYVSKSFDNTALDKGKKMYYSSKGLKQAEKIDEGVLDYIDIDKIDWSFTNDYVKLKDLNKDEYLQFIKDIKKS